MPPRKEILNHSVVAPLHHCEQGLLVSEKQAFYDINVLLLLLLAQTRPIVAVFILLIGAIRIRTMGETPKLAHYLF